jgi:hypothetical protein
MSDHKLIKVLVLLTFLLVIPLQMTAAQAEARVGVFTAYAAPLQTRLEVPIEVRGVQNLYAIELEMTYDPAILAVEDADPATEGIQPALGTFLDAGMVLFHTVDPQAGVVHFVMTQVNPAEPKSGDGIILVVYFVTQGEGTSPLTVSNVTLSDRDGTAIPASLVSSQVEVAAGNPTPQATSIPVQNPTALIIIPTMAPTATPEPTPLPTATTQPSAEVVQPTQPAAGQQNSAATPEGPVGFTEVDDNSGGQLPWVWLAVLAAVIAVGLVLRRKWSQPSGGQAEGAAKPEQPGPTETGPQPEGEQTAAEPQQPGADETPRPQP